MPRADGGSQVCRKRNLFKCLTFLSKWQMCFILIILNSFWISNVVGHFWYFWTIKYSSLYTLSAIWKIIALLGYLVEYAYHFVPFLLWNISTKCCLVALEFTQVGALVWETAMKSHIQNPQSPEKHSWYWAKIQDKVMFRGKEIMCLGKKKNY